ncbi:MAG: YadA-like family protein [Megasphaera sp.]|nr:YadA-like family protein [Megasphaera sp.]
MIGSHNYRGKIGDQTVDTSKTNTYGININATTLGTNSFNQGAFSSVTGAYSIISGKYNGSGFSSYGVQNFGATITGSLNSIESATSSNKYSGIANSIVGVANRTSNSNGSLIFGAGNEIKNSITAISAPLSGGDSAKALQDNLMESVQDSESGGATLAIGGGNKADYTQKTQIIGVNNTVTGTASLISAYNMVDGFGNTVTSASHLYTIGADNNITDVQNTLLFGDNREINGVDNSVILGSADSPLTTTAKNVTVLGYQANATVDGGVAIGSGSIASVASGVYGWDPVARTVSTSDLPAWKSSWGAVSVGDGTHTRQITNVAAGFNDTDAVNVAQLKSAMNTMVPSLIAGDGIRIDGANGTYVISADLVGGSTVTDDVHVTPETEFPEESGNGDPVPMLMADSNTMRLQPYPDHRLVITADTAPTHFAADSGTAAVVRPSETLTISGDAKNIATEVEGNTISVHLADNIQVTSVKTGDTQMTTNGITIADGPSMTKNGVDAGGQKITHVAAGTEADDAVNYGQLKTVEDKVASNTESIYHIDSRVSNLDNKVNKVGAGAAALAALHPLDFDPDDKWDFAVGYGNYRNANSVAFGAFYRPNEDTMISLGTNFGNGENMFNAGLSFKIGQGSGVTTSRTAMAKKIAELEAIVKEQGELLKQYVSQK